MNETLRLRTVLRSSSLRLGPDEIDYFVHRVRTSSKARTKTTPSRISWSRLAIEAATATWAAQKTCAAFSRRVAYMDHSDNGIRALFERAEVQWEEPKKLRLSRAERLLATIIAIRFVQVNRSVMHSVLHDAGVDLGLAADRLAAGAGCFGRFTAQAVLAPESWRGLFLTADVSFLRMFACYAAVRAHRPISMYLGHRTGTYWNLPFIADTLFTLDSSAVEHFNTPPRQVVVDALKARARPNPTSPPYDVGIVTDIFIEISQVWAAAEDLAQHPSVKSVQIRLHPRSRVKKLPDGMSDNIVLCQSQEPLSMFSEGIDFAVVSNSSAVPVLQDLLLPCFFFARLYGEFEDSRNLSFAVAGRYPPPEILGELRDFVSALKLNSLEAERSRLGSLVGGASECAETRELMRKALKLFT